MSVLVDTSVWIDYFRLGRHSRALDTLIEDNLIVTNDIILAELFPYLKVKKEFQLISLLNSIEKAPIHINWEELIDYQTACLAQGINGIGIPDLIIAQHACKNQCKIYTLDKHFRLLSQVLPIDLF
jgi:predicted nucleic acid-binding protein